MKWPQNILFLFHSMFSLEITGVDSLLNVKVFKVAAGFFAYFICKISNAI